MTAYKMKRHELSAEGMLSIVGTPIGNLGDISFRAVDTLGGAYLIAAEDTRRTKILLNHYKLKTPLTSYNSYNKDKKGPELLKHMKNGHEIALVSDAGMPGISDPLYHLVKSVIEEKILVQAIPGPSASLSALVISGLPMDRFSFEGFLPRKKRRKQTLTNLAEDPRTVILYESPKRLNKTLKDLLETFGNRDIVIARELTKIHEETIRGKLSEIINEAEKRTWKGEVTLVMAGRPKS
jgi:16S rRNA (cytidine1402-2'-O)-methyltransferase